VYNVGLNDTAANNVVERSNISPAPARHSRPLRVLAAIDFAHRQSRHLVLTGANRRDIQHTRCLKGTEVDYR
jgi:hypothetical protein